MPHDREGPRLEKKRHFEAEERIRTYILRLREDPTYDYAGREEDLALMRRKCREGRAREVLDRGRRSA